jgi:monoamine oxidase
MARQYRLARALGLPAAAVAERQSEQKSVAARGLTRRHFLQKAVWAAALMSVPRWCRASEPAHARIAIVGAGIAGLNCALTLADRGLRPAIFEASGRVGGRMFSNNVGYWSGGQVSEWCGELIDSGHAAIRQLAAQFDLPLDDLLAAQPSGAEDLYYFKAGRYPRAEAVKDFQPVFEAIQRDFAAAGPSATCQSSTPAAQALDTMSLWHWIRRRVPGGHDSKLGQLLDIAFTVETGADTTEQSALNLIYMLSGSDRQFEIFGSSDERFHIRGGNEQLPQAMARRLAALGIPVRTAMSLAAIGRRADGAYRLRFSAGTSTAEVVADLVVLALPFAVLRKLDYAGAGFDSLKRRAIEELGRGGNAKLQVQFARRFWNEPAPWGVGTGSSYADTGYQTTWDTTRGQPGSTGILSNYTGGPVAGAIHSRAPFARVASAAVNADSLRFLAQLRPVLPRSAALWNGKAAMSAPYRSPFLRCSYSFWRVGQYHTLAGYERMRQQNVFFAGEHTSVEYQGYMEGAAREGQRAAREILLQLGR